jgi:hypothetical protein
MAGGSISRRLVMAAVLCSSLSARAEDPPTTPVKDFDFALSVHGHVQSFTYPDRGPDNWIDAIVGLEAEVVRYRRTYFVLRFENETDMGHSDEPLKAFDPNRGRWTFGASARSELQAHFFEAIVRHDCYHGIDRWYPGQDYKMTGFGVGFGTLGYLQKYRFPGDGDAGSSVHFPLRLQYYLAPTFYYPRGEPWQRIPYVVRVEADARLELVRWSRLGLGLETINVFYYGNAHEVQSSHAVDVDVYLYGNSLALLLYAGWWPYDSQVFRNRDGKVVAGLEISF